jgi:hypothetical protein
VVEAVVRVSQQRSPVRVPVSRGLFRAGEARALTFASVEHDGIGTAGVDGELAQIVS